MLFGSDPSVARLLALPLLCCQAYAICSHAETTAADQRGLAARFVTDSGVKGGLIVHIGCGDGRLTAALRLDERYLVQGLDTDAANIEKARSTIHGLNVYGPVSVGQFDGAHYLSGVDARLIKAGGKAHLFL